MKVSLIVASGVHQGKTIPVNGVKFVIGRDPDCQLRPASQAISKQHCALLIREGKVFAVDYGSMNGTSINDQLLTPNEEREVKQGDRLKAGPLDFTIGLAMTKPSDSTPLPADLQKVDASASGRLKEAATGSKPAQPKVPAKSDSEDDIAAILLGMNDDSPGSGAVPEGSTIMEMPVELAQKPGEEKKDEKKTNSQMKEDSSNAASDLLRKYMRRPR